MDYLANLNPHERDSHISFDEGPHIYTIDGDSDFMSVTKWNHSHFPHFNAKKIIDKMMASKNWPQSKYFGMTPQQIKDQWSENGRQASDAGTKMHYDIECFYNNMDVNNDSIEYKYFKEFLQMHDGFKPYRTEWMVWDTELKFAGSIDMTFQRKDGTIDIYDWKRCKEIKKLNRWESATTECINYLPNSNFWHYSLQLNTYKALLEKNYGVKVGDMYLVCLHPNNKNNTYIKIKCADLSEEVAMLFDLRRTMLN
jgi:ATP-dependent exoDNAse (exonuclease V) beta subunit